jgi:hypothetical protein
MAARRRVFFHDQNGSPPVCRQAMAFGQMDGPALARRHNMKVSRHMLLPLSSALSDKIAGYLKRQTAQLQTC